MDNQAFDVDEAFDEFKDLWEKACGKAPKYDSEERAAFAAVVTSPEHWEKLRDSIEVRIQDNVKLPKKMQLFFGEVFGSVPARARTAAVQVEETSSSSPYGNSTSTDTTDPAVIAAFEEVWPLWPRNDFPQSQKDAKAAFKDAAKSLGLDVVMAACKAYIDHFSDVSNGLLNPKHLKNFLGEDDGDTARMWYEHAKNMPTDAEKTEFQGVWAWYPEYDNKELQFRDAFSFWRRHVRPEDRFDFLCAVKAYRSRRRGELNKVKDPVELKEQEKFTLGFIKFVARWRDESRSQQVADAVILPLRKLTKAAGLDPGGEYKMHDALRWGAVSKLSLAEGAAHAVRSCMKGKDLWPVPDELDVEGTVEKALTIAYEDACKPPIDVRLSVVDPQATSY